MTWVDEQEEHIIRIGKEDKTTPFSVKLMRSQGLSRAAQGEHVITVGVCDLCLQS